jgi:23S rRNA pseudouridine1911/1915/1917 synthase
VYGGRAGREARRAGDLGTRIAAFPRQALHANRLGFQHPATGEQIRFDSPLPADMAELACILERL